ncbi:hypothetical protein D9756_007408 [Leucocoprinus leucothites]|uniref:HMG box domain-containing protein n=1 Tax=Leucocoprinus leucothites TaxID=201217 RepID=A0A8H5D1B7_9AGAR|nr:hypothetical protein D9756_007408 [Leucoagaricus leucothites]
MAGVVRTMPSHSSRPAAPRVVKAPRPPNAWIIYRSDKVHQLPPLEPGQPRRAQADVSKMISSMWANESEETRQEYERRAEEAKAAHALKYPGYRFKPMKKEEKRAQREQEQNERLAKRREWRKPGSTPDRSSVPPAFTAPLPQYYASINMPINLPQLGQGLPPPLPYPLVSYYPSQPLFGPAGPTPPVSAAASPNDHSSSPSASTSMDESQSPPKTLENINPNLSIPTETKGMMTPAAPSPLTPTSGSATLTNTPTFPTFNSPAFASGQEWAGTPTSITTKNGTLTPALTPSPLGQDSEWNQQQQQLQAPQEQRSTAPAVPMETLSFNLEPFHLSNLDNLLSGSTDEVLSTFLTGTSDPGVFELSNIDPSRLTAGPTGEIEVSLGDSLNHLDLSLFPSSLFSIGDSFNLSQNNTTAPEFYIPQPIPIPNDGVTQAMNHEVSAANMGYNPDDYLDFGASSAFGETNDMPLLASEAASAQADQCVANMGPYVPPSGAVNSAIRRVGGSWTKQFMKAQTTGLTQSQ